MRPFGQRAFIAALLVLRAVVAQAGPPPLVYEDDHIAVRAAVAEAGKQPLHIGDALTLLVEVSFDPSQVQVESLDTDYFQRALAGLAAAAVYHPQEMSAASESGAGPDNGVRLSAAWQFQLLACPQDLASCPGHRRYDLPLMTLAYRIRGEDGSSTSSRSARFTPWPGSITLTPALRFDPAGETRLEHVIPGSAYPEAASADGGNVAGPLLVAAGALLLGLVSVSGRRRVMRFEPGSNSYASATRWQHAAAALENPRLGDAEWSDLLRRSVTWYSLDELGSNPCDYLYGGPTDADADARAAECASLFRDTLAEVTIESARRGEFLARLRRITGQPAAITGRG